MTTIQLTATRAAAAERTGILFAEAVPCPALALCEIRSDNCTCSDRPVIPPVKPGAQITVQIPCETCHDGLLDRGQVHPQAWGGHPAPCRSICPDCKGTTTVPAFTATVTEVLPVLKMGDGNQPCPTDPHVCAFHGRFGNEPIDQWTYWDGRYDHELDMTAWPDVTPGYWYALVLEREPS